MEKKVGLSLIVILCLLIIIPTILRISKTHQDRLIAVSEKRIIEAAQNCYAQDRCLEDIIYLKDLYEFGYLEKQYDPISKVYYSEESYVLKKEDTYIFIADI